MVVLIKRGSIAALPLAWAPIAWSQERQREPIPALRQA